MWCMVEQQHVLLRRRGAAGARAAAGRAPGRTAAPPRPAPAVAPSPRAASAAARADRRAAAARSRLADDLLTGSPSAGTKRVRSDLVARERSRRARARKAPHVRARRQTRTRDRDVVERRARLELVEEPEPLLRERERQRVLAGCRRQADAARGPASSRIDSGSAARATAVHWTVRAARDHRSPRCCRPAGRAHPASARAGSAGRPRRRRLRRESADACSCATQRVAAEVEEVVGARRPRRPSSTSLQIGDELSSVALRGATCAPAPASPCGAGKRRRSTLPFGVSGSSASGTITAGTM